MGWNGYCCLGLVPEREIMSKRPNTLTPLEVSQFLDHVRVCSELGSRFRNGSRNYLMCVLMLDAGLRVGEVVKLKVSDFIFGETIVSSLLIKKAISKSKQDRLLPLSNRIREAIVLCRESWWKTLRTTPDMFAFYSICNSIRLSTRQVERIVRRHACDSIGRLISPHTLRHTFGTRLMRQVNSRIAQELLGHKNIQTTMLYQHPNHDDLSQAIEKISEDD